ncbi:MAG: hypothetical protein IPJ60_01985 [Sphingobacteriaceae bacterium]|nr:hypothetical protein [Sphingobacteriaceae bacterium]
MNEVEIYKSADSEIEIRVQFENETVWLMQNQIAELFQRDRTVITKHISKIFKDGELEEKSNVQKMHIPNSDKPAVVAQSQLEERINDTIGSQPY